MHLHNCPNATEFPRKLAPSLKSKKNLCRSLLLTTAWLLCDIFGSNFAFAEPTIESISSDVKSTDSKVEDIKEDAKEDAKDDGAKDDAKKETADYHKPVFSKNELNVLDVPDSAISDFDQITKKIFEKKDQGYTDTLDEAMTSAYETNPDIKGQRARLRATDEGIVQAKAGWRPKINGFLTGSLTHNKVNPDDSRNNNIDNLNSNNKSAQQQAQIQLQQNIFQGGNTVYSTRAALSAIKANRAALKNTEQEILLNSVTAYLALLAQYAALEYLLQNEEGQKKALEQNMAKYEAGDETRTTVAQSEYAYTDAVAQRVRAEGELESFKADYEKVINRKPGNLTVPAIPEVPDSLEKVLEQVRLNNPQIIQNQYEEQQARHNIDVTQTGLLPKIDLTASSSALLNRNKDTKRQQGAGENRKYFTDKTVNNSLQLQMTVPLYEGGDTRSKTRQAAEQASQQRIKIESVRRDVIDRASRAWNDLISAKRNRDVLKNQMKAAETSVEGVRQEVEVGARTYLDVVTETTKLINAQRFYVDAERTYRLAAFQVLYWMGALSPKSQKLPVEVYDPKAHYNEVKNKF